MKRSPCCQAVWYWETLQGIRVFRMVGRKKRYTVQCSACGAFYMVKHTGEV